MFVIEVDCSQPCLLIALLAYLRLAMLRSPLFKSRTLFKSGCCFDPPRHKFHFTYIIRIGLVGLWPAQTKTDRRLTKSIFFVPRYDTYKLREYIQ